MTDDEIVAGLADWFGNYFANPSQENQDKLTAFVLANKDAVTVLVADYKLEVIAADEAKKAEQQVHLAEEATKWTTVKTQVEAKIL